MISGWDTILFLLVVGLIGLVLVLLGMNVGKTNKGEKKGWRLFI